MSQIKEDLYGATSRLNFFKRYSVPNTKKPECVWFDFFDDNAKVELKDQLTFIGIASSLTTFWLLAQRKKLWMKTFVSIHTYTNFCNFILAMLLRVFIPLVMDALKSIGCFGLTCNFTAFVETFLVVYEVESLTHVCIERYVVAKYLTNGWAKRNVHYKLYICLCFFFAVLYSAPAYYIWDGYEKDFICYKCSYGMVLPNDWSRPVVVITYLLRSVKPLVFMFAMLVWATNLEEKFTPDMKKISNVKFTELVKSLVIMNIFFWAPLALLRGWVITSQLLYNWISVPYCYSKCVRWAMIFYQASPLMTALGIILKDRESYYADNEGSGDNEEQEHPHEE